MLTGRRLEYGPGPGAPDRPARWARSFDLRSVRLRRRTPGRLVLGRSGSWLLACENRQSAIVIGPTRSYKTTGLVIPALLDWPGPVLAASIKADVLEATARYRRRLGRVEVISPAEAIGPAGFWYDPVPAADSWDAARRVAFEWCRAAAATRPLGHDGEFWFRLAGRLLGPMVLAASRAGAGIEMLVGWIEEQDLATPARLLGRPEDQEALRALGATWRRDDRQRSSVFTMAEIVVESLVPPPGIRGPDDRPVVGHDLSWLVAGGSDTLFLSAPALDQVRYQPLLSGVVDKVLSLAFTKATVQRAPLDPPLLVLIDEAAHIAPLPDLDALAATAAGHGVQLVTIWQDLAQVEARYGPKYRTVVNNHRAKVLLSGVSDPGTLELFSRLAGEAGPSRSQMAAPGRGTARQPLAPPAGLRRLRPGRGVLVYGHLPPAKLVLVPYFKDRGLLAKAAADEGPGRNRRDRFRRDDDGPSDHWLAPTHS